jgi:hypothetical protein
MFLNELMIWLIRLARLESSLSIRWKTFSISQIISLDNCNIMILLNSMNFQIDRIIILLIRIWATPERTYSAIHGPERLPNYQCWSPPTHTPKWNGPLLTSRQSLIASDRWGVLSHTLAPSSILVNSHFHYFLPNLLLHIVLHFDLILPPVQAPSSDLRSKHYKNWQSWSGTDFSCWRVRSCTNFSY